jgi:leader peptidase (prepilin peptidase) / N-methyltransferase
LNYIHYILIAIAGIVAGRILLFRINNSRVKIAEELEKEKAAQKDGAEQEPASSLRIKNPTVYCLTVILFILSWHQHSQPQIAITGMIFFSLLIMGIVIDMETMILPDECTTWGAIIGIIASIAIPSLHLTEIQLHHNLLDHIQSGGSAALGAIIGSGMLLWIAIMGELVLKKEVMGFGDILLMGCIGAFCGWEGAIFSIFSGAMLGTIILLPMVILQKIFNNPENNQDLGFGSKIPFGPWLAAGAILNFLFSQDLADNYIGNLALFLPQN